MRDVLTQLRAWWEAGEPVGLATVVDTFRSAPRAPGATMLVGPGGEAVGSVSGGCVEAAVYDLAQAAAAGADPVRQAYGISSDTAFSVGLTCGGVIELFVERIDRATFPELGLVADDIDAGRPVAVATVVEHPDPSALGRRIVVRPSAEPDVLGSLGSARVDAAVSQDVLGLLGTGDSRLLRYGPEGQRLGTGMGVFVTAMAPKPRLVVFGAIDFAGGMARLGAMLGYHVTVCDARPVFASVARFPEADEVVVDWPHRYLAAEVEAGRIDGRTVLCVLTHDAKFDIPLLEVALRLPEDVYVGAMGSRATHEARVARLAEAGLTGTEIARLRSPIGLDLGARTPEETAVSIAAEIISWRSGRTARPLTESTETIHAEQ